MGKRFALGLAALVCQMVVATAMAQINVERFERQLDQIERQSRLMAPPEVPPDQRAYVDYGGYLSFSFLAIDDPDNKTHILRRTSANVFAMVNFDNAHEFFMRVRTTYDDFNTGDSFSRHGDDWVEPTMDRAYYRFDLQQYVQANEGDRIDGNFVIQAGRQLVNWANGLTLSQELDGGTIMLAVSDLQLDIVAGVTRDSVADFDSSRPDFDGDTHRGFYGGMLTYHAHPKFRPYVYGLVQEDYNKDTALIVGPTTTRFDYNSHYIGAGVNGGLGERWQYGIEAVYQGGKGLSNSFDQNFNAITQTLEDIHAYALDARLDYYFTDVNQSRVGFEILLASGDNDRLTTSNTFGGNRSGTNDTAFNAFGLLNTGLAFAPDASNLLMLRAGGSTFPLPRHDATRRLQVGGNVYVFNKLQSDAPIDEATNDQSYLGTELDLFTNWQLTSDLTWQLQYGVFFPGQAIEADHQARHFFFTGVTLSF